MERNFEVTVEYKINFEILKNIFFSSFFAPSFVTSLQHEHRNGIPKATFTMKISTTFLPNRFLNLHIYGRACWSWGPDILKFSVLKKVKETAFLLLNILNFTILKSLFSIMAPHCMEEIVTVLHQ